MDKQMTEGQFGAWLIVGTVGPILSIIGRGSWLTVFFAAVICGAFSFSVLTCKQTEMPRWLCATELIWLTVFLGGTANLSGTCWQSWGELPMIQWTLLILAALAACKGASRASRAGSTLLWLVAPVLGVVMLAGVTDVDPSWLRGELETPDGLLIALLLAPCLGCFLPRECSKGVRWIAPLLGVLAIAGALLLDGAMGSTAQIADNSFYEFSKGISLFGVAERFESLVACALTLSWFAFFAMILSGVYHLTEKIFRPAAGWSVWVVAVGAGGLMCILPKSDYWMAIGSLIFWVFLTLITQGLGGAKKMEKK